MAYLKKWKNPINTLTYNSWRAMRNRCLYDNSNNKNYKLKGIKICDSWLNDFDQFVEDMGKRPVNTTLDRIDSNGDYEPSNCRWSSLQKQANNKEVNVFITYNQKTKTISEWVDYLGLNKTERSRVYKRYSKYNAKTYEELFTKERLFNKRLKERTNKCLSCQTEKTCKWRRDGKLCNTCWHKEYRKKSQDTPR